MLGMISRPIQEAQYLSCDYRKDFMGECGKEESEKILDYFYESGGNFIDTSNNYQKEESEIWIGEWMKKRNIRDQMVIATKFTTYVFILLQCFS